MKLKMTTGFVLLLCSSASAQEPDRFAGHVRVNGVLFENFFQAPDGEPAEDVPAAGIEVAAGTPLRRDGPLRLFGEVEYTRYRRYRPSAGFAVGLRQDSRPRSFAVRFQYVDGRPRREILDEFARADALGLTARYGHRIGDDWELTGLGELRRESYEGFATRRNDVYSIGASLRFRGFRHLSPEAGVRVGGRNVRDDAEDLGQRELYLQLRWFPSAASYFTLRVRRRHREYSVDDPAAFNFGRVDTRLQWVATADLRRNQRLGWRAYYAIESSDSTRPSRSFTTQILSVGAVLRF